MGLDRVSPIKVQFIYRTKVGDTPPRWSEVKVGMFSMKPGETIMWDEGNSALLSMNTLRIDAPDYDYELRMAKQQGREELLEELSTLTVAELSERIAELTREPYYVD